MCKTSTVIGMSPSNLSQMGQPIRTCFCLTEVSSHAIQAGGMATGLSKVRTGFFFTEALGGSVMKSQHVSLTPQKKGLSFPGILANRA